MEPDTYLDEIKGLLIQVYIKKVTTRCTKLSSTKSLVSTQVKTSSIHCSALHTTSASCHLPGVSFNYFYLLLLWLVSKGKLHSEGSLTGKTWKVSPLKFGPGKNSMPSLPCPYRYRYPPANRTFYSSNSPSLLKYPTLLWTKQTIFRIIYK